jgi:hypothetical protein
MTDRDKDEQDEHWQRFNAALKHIVNLTPEQVKKIQEATPEPDDLPEEDLKDE